jgi:hypothetical protein
MNIIFDLHLSDLCPHFQEHQGIQQGLRVYFSHQYVQKICVLQKPGAVNRHTHVYVI